MSVDTIRETLPEDMAVFASFAAAWPPSDGTTRRAWTVDEDALLETYWQVVAAADFALTFNRTRTAIYQRAAHLNLETKRPLWTKEEVRALQAGTPSAKLSRRTQRAILRKRERLAQASASKS